MKKHALDKGSSLYKLGLVTYIVTILGLLTTLILNMLFSCDGVCENAGDEFGVLMVLPVLLMTLATSFVALLILTIDRYVKNGSTGIYRTKGLYYIISILCFYIVFLLL